MVGYSKCLQFCAYVKPLATLDFSICLTIKSEDFSFELFLDGLFDLLICYISKLLDILTSICGY